MTERSLVPALWRDVLACPECLGALDGEARCEGCGARHGAVGGALELVPRALRLAKDGDEPGWQRWREAAAGLEAWRARRAPSVTRSAPAIDPRIVALVEAAGLAGTVVDVGGKDGAKRAAMPAPVTRYLSVDPFAERREGLPEDTLAVRGLAEALPVRDGAADGVFSTAAMDYFVDPAKAVGELARVLRAGGVAALLVTVHPPSVGRARGASTRARRVAGALGPSVVREVGARGALTLAWDALAAPLREHTAYLTEPAVLAWLAPHFETLRLDRTRGAYSETLRWIGRKRQG